MYKTLLFDMDGVLLDTERMSFHIWRDYLRQWDFVFEKEHYAVIFGAPPEGYAEYMSRELPVSKEMLFQHWFETVDQRTQSRDIPTAPGFTELMDFLKSYPGKKGIVTANGGAPLAGYIQLFDFHNLFDGIYDAHLVSRLKPEPDLYLCALQSLQVAPEDCIAIEDSQWGVLAAQRAGIPVIHMRGLFDIPESLERSCLSTISSLAELIPIVEKIKEVNRNGL